MTASRFHHLLSQVALLICFVQRNIRLTAQGPQLNRQFPLPVAPQVFVPHMDSVSRLQGTFDGLPEEVKLQLQPQLVLVRVHIEAGFFLGGNDTSTQVSGTGGKWPVVPGFNKLVFLGLLSNNLVQGSVLGVYFDASDALENVCDIQGARIWGAHIQSFLTLVTAIVGWRWALSDGRVIPLGDVSHTLLSCYFHYTVPAALEHKPTQVDALVSDDDISVGKDDKWHRAVYEHGLKWVIWKGWLPGVLNTWQQAHAEIHGLMEPQDAYQKFATHTAALATWEILAAKGYTKEDKKAANRLKSKRYYDRNRKVILQSQQQKRVAAEEANTVHSRLEKWKDHAVQAVAYLDKVVGISNQTGTLTKSWIKLGKIELMLKHCNAVVLQEAGIGPEYTVIYSKLTWVSMKNGMGKDMTTNTLCPAWTAPMQSANIEQHIYMCLQGLHHHHH
ncbi:hypothetical protein L208DRAFT_1381891 [Tricholoma matsutake]|nr:hypothetical protein L208DRAFT_1381891 [Tricholoma matsutake 945]